MLDYRSFVLNKFNHHAQLAQSQSSPLNQPRYFVGQPPPRPRLTFVSEIDRLIVIGEWDNHIQPQFWTVVTLYISFGKQYCLASFDRKLSSMDKAGTPGVYYWEPGNPETDHVFNNLINEWVKRIEECPEPAPSLSNANPVVKEWVKRIDKYTEPKP